MQLHMPSNTSIQIEARLIVVASLCIQVVLHWLSSILSPFYSCLRPLSVAHTSFDKIWSLCFANRISSSPLPTYLRPCLSSRCLTHWPRPSFQPRYLNKFGSQINWLDTSWTDPDQVQLIFQNLSNSFYVLCFMQNSVPDNFLTS